MKILIIGSSGMAGHMVYAYLREREHNVFGIDLFNNGKTVDKKLDISDKKEVVDFFSENSFDWVINCVAILGNLVAEKMADSIYVNAFFPHFLNSLLPPSTHIIQISSDYVFSGERGQYKISDPKNNLTTYGIEKNLCEIVSPRVINLRLSIIGPSFGMKSNNFFNNLFNNQSNSETHFFGYNNVFSTLITTLTLAKAIEEILNRKISNGTFHLCSQEKKSKYEIMVCINEIFNLKRNIKQVQDLNPRDYSLLSNFSWIVPSLESQLSEMSVWMKSHSDFYF